MLDFDMASGSDARAVLEALGRSLAIVEFEPDGTILSANENFCRALGYDLSEIKGRHHSLFVEQDYAKSAAYKDFWAKLGCGDFEANEYKCIGKDGREIWIQASYNPIKDKHGAVLKIVKAATDITGVKIQHAGWGNTRSGTQAFVEFTPDGTVITANENFLNTFNYNLEDVQGKHHSHFVDPSFAQSTAYRSFWRRLDDGEFVAASFKCVGKGGKEVWIQASYNPIVDDNQNVVKIVKFADDISDFTEIESGLARLALNDLTGTIEKAVDPRFETIRLNFNQAVGSLGSALRSVGETAGALETRMLDIAAAGQDVGQNNDRQAAGLTEASDALQRIAAIVKRVGDGAGHTHRAVAAVDDDVKSSAVVVRKAADSLDVVASSARQMRHIIGVIDEIAFQTNLLALSAGVEAARSGDAGRGFGLVATEVRRLAQRSSEAAKEVKGLILTSATQVQHGLVLIGEIGKSLRRIVTRVAEINEGIADIAAGTEGQALRLSELDVCIDQMVDITQKNVTKIDERAAAAQALSREIQELSRLVSQFGAGSGSSSAASEHRAVVPKPMPRAKGRRAERSIRSFEEGDIPRVCELFAKTFRAGKAYDTERLAACIRETYLAPPSYTPETGSIVHLNGAGIVDGFMGVIPITYRLGERSIRAGILSAFMADNPKENPKIGVALLRGVLGRSFDLLFTDTANQTSLLMCRATHFFILPQQSLEWFKLLRPAETSFHVLAKRIRLASWLFRPVAAGIDRLVSRRLAPRADREKRFHGVTDHLIDVAEFVAEASKFLDTYRLRPQWGDWDLSWLAAQARLQTKNGDLEIHAVHDRSGQRAGLYLIYLRKGFVAYVLQVLARPGREEIVMDRIMQRAAEVGAIAVRGATTREVSHGLLCYPGVLYRHVMTTVAWTDDADVAAAVKSGDIFIGGLAGETWAKIVAEDF